MPRNILKIMPLLAFFMAAALPGHAESPLTWEDCVREAAVANPELEAARAAIRRSRNQVGASRSDFFPTLTPFVGYNASNSSNFRTSPNPDNPGVDVNFVTRQQLELGINLDQNIFSGFQTKAGYDRSKSQLTETEAAYQVTRADVSLDLKTAFARLLFYQEQSFVVRRIVERRKENVRFVELRFEGGRENMGSVMRNRALLEQAQYDLSQTQRSLRVAQRELAKVLGRRFEDSYENLHVKGGFQTHLPKASPDFNTLVLNHPEHRMAEAQTRTARADLRLAKGDLYPSVDANASVSLDKLNNRGDNALWSAGVNITYPFFTGGRDIYELRGARAEQFRVRENLRETDNQLALRLKQAYADFKNAVEAIRVQENFLKASEVRAEIGRSQYANGLISYQDWDLVENDLINNQRTILESGRDALLAEAAWERAQGRGAIP
ncbi:MAG TPA: hypothetical protein DF383_01040 [Deltaproteobacteria bacterium]|nr:hypothetical protein [Deltaproteobacteria bacterium]